MGSDQSAYWDRVAAEKTFTHPLNAALLKREVPAASRWLDFGCGYGRLSRELRDLGFSQVLGLDFSESMVERAKQESPELDVRRDLGPDRDSELGRFDAVLLFSVLTCLPEDRKLVELLARIRGLLDPGGLLYVSDLTLQQDERNIRRYADCHGGPYGTFHLPEGARLRHFNEPFLRELFAGFEELHFEPLTVQTMNGNSARGFQYLGRRTA